MELENQAKKEIKRMKDIIDKVELLDEKGRSLLEAARTYFSDAEIFLSKKQFLEAFEAAVIVWSYIDAGLHIGVFHVPTAFEKLFTA